MSPNAAKIITCPSRDVRVVWAAGKTAYEAIGDLIVHHPESLGILVEFPGSAPAKQLVNDRLFILYGEFPEPLYLLQMPDKGVRWRVLMQGARRLAKRIKGIPAHKAAPYWNVERIEQELKNPQQYKRFAWNNDNAGV